VTDAGGTGTNGTEPGRPRPRPRAHARRGIGSYVFPAVVGGAALIAITVGIVGWVRPLASDSAAAASHSPVPVPRVSTTAADPTPLPTPSSPTAVPSPTRTATPTPKPTPTPTVPAATRPAVVVLNQTATVGLAAKVAARLRGAGWVVPAVGNYRGSVPSTTVFYPAGRQPAAQSLARALGATRTAPALAGMSASRLTVVLTSNPFG
jgi:hypothetical protein